eukprot:TRINITY_DN1662_c0_g1_i9.p1 TRINITY_DN1662_c0_g1~~TRINITY_DN1662_c0_g1_i9.p1  ORF type:complete len:290 (-),score=87.81 TRINITY_DN1662_c0_g1_i9:11-880(-)
MFAVKLLFLVAPFALALEQDLALVQFQAEKLLSDGADPIDETEDNPVDVVSHAKDATKAAGARADSGVHHAFGHQKKKHAVSKTKANAPKMHVVVAHKAKPSQKHVVAPKAKPSQKHVIALKAKQSQKHVVAPKAKQSQKHVAAPKANASQKRAARKVRFARKHAASLRARKAKKQHQVPTQTVSFYLHDANTEYGDRIVIVGDDDQFGNWEPMNGMDLTTDESMFPKWKLENVQVEFPKATLEYKFVVLKDKPKGKVEWEEFGVEANRKLTMSMDAIAVVNADYGVLA